ncbi:unnamed protein product [Prunus armeniaca]
MAVETKFQHLFGGTGCLRHASEFVSDHERHVDIEPVESISQGAENTLPTPTPGMSSVAADTVMRLPVMQPHAPPLLGTSDTAAGTAPQLLAVLPPTPSCLGTRDTAADTSP